MITAASLKTSAEFDEYGLLRNPDDWDEPLALSIANQLGIGPLTTDHWKVIRALRQHYQKFGTVPTIHNICHEHGKKSDWVHNLFQSCLNAWRVAGLPDPGEEAKSYMSDM
jgi:tRNA 2-thiouridine synthesizing protein E